MAAWQFVALLPDGTMVADLVGASGRKVVARLEEPDSIEWRQSGTDPTMASIAALKTDVVAYRDGEPLTRGRIGPGARDIGPAGHQVVLAALDYRQLLRGREINPAARLAFAQVDQASILWRLIRDTQNLPGGDLGLTLGPVGTTGVKRDRTYEAGKLIGDAIDELALIDGGFDWDISPDLTVDVYYPSRGRLKDFVAHFGVTVDQVAENTNPGEYANTVRATGADGVTPVVVTVDDLESRREGRWEAQVGLSDVKDASTLEEKAAGELATRSTLRPTYTVTLAPGVWRGTQTLWKGDECRVVIVDGDLDVDEVLRVFEIEVEISDDGTEVVKVTFGRAPVDPDRRVAKLVRRVQRLERRSATSVVDPDPTLAATSDAGPSDAVPPSQAAVAAFVAEQISLVADGSSAPTGAAAGDLDGTYPAPTLRAGAVGTTALADLAVTTPKLGAGAVTVAKMAATGTAHAGVSHLGDDSWGLPMPSPSRFSLTEATATAFLAKADSTIVKELWLGDSMSSLKASDAEQTSVPAIYEAEMAEVFNLMPRGARGGTSEKMGTGHVPVQMINAFGTAATQIKWDTVQGTAPYRGPAFSNRLLTSGQYCEVTRYGTAVTVFYTKSRDNAGTIQVTINGVAQTAINTRDAALTPAYDSGYSVTYARPGTSGAYGPMVVRVDCTAGQSDLESAYFHAQNSNAGHRLYRIDQSSQTMGGFTNADWFPQYIGRVQPHIITIYMGHNDAVGGGVSASGLATRLETQVGVIRARYSTWLPAIRYVFQGESATSPSDWVTTYLPTLRAKCQALGVAFLDTYTAQNTYRSTDYLDVIDADGLHPNDTGSRLIGQLVADWTKKTTRPNRRPFQVADHYQHVDLGLFGAIRMLAANGQNLVLGQWAGVGGGTAAATGSGQLLGQLLFYGAKNAYGDMIQGAGISAIAEALWVDGATYTTTLRLATTNGTTSSVKVGVTGSGTLFIGATLAGANAKVTAAGAADFTSLTVGGVPVAGGGRLAYVGSNATVGNTSGTLTTITSYTVAVPAATLVNNGDSLLARYTFTTPAAGPYSPTFQVLLGGVVAVNQHTITTNAGTAGAVVAEVEILRLSATTARCSVRLAFGSATGLGAAYKTMTSIPSLDSNSNDLLLKMSQGHTSPDDITVTSLVVEVVRG